MDEEPTYDVSDQEYVGKHQRRKGKKKFKLVWRYKGELPKFTYPLQELFFYPMAKKYHSEKAVKQAIKDWEEHRGSWKTGETIHYPADLWEPIIEKL